MLNQNHPDDERLSALASHDTDATDDATLTAHVTSCDRCTDLVTELSVLRAALAELPDVAPSRPLQLLPPVGAASEPATADRVGGWVRRFFAPVVASGAALALVGVIGTAAPALQGFAPTAGSAPGAQEEITAPAASSAGEAAGAGGDVFAESSDSAQRDQAQASDGNALLHATDDVAAAEPSTASVAGGADEDYGRTSMEQERSPWPMVLFAGVALMIGALLARWILAPRST